MRRIFKHQTSRLSAILLIILSAFLLGGCVQAKETVTETKNATNIRFSWWGTDARHEYTMNAIDTFQDLNPDIRVNITYGVWNGFEKRNKVAMKSNTEADVMQINYAWLSTYSPDGDGYYDLYQLADEIDLSQFSQENLDFGVVNGKLNAIPIALNMFVPLYNKTLYESYGLEIPKDWDDYFEAAKVMSQDNVYPIGMGKKQAFLFLIAHFEQTTGKSVFDDDGNLAITAEDMQEILSFYRLLIDEKVLSPIDQFDQINFTNGEIAGVVCWISDIGTYETALQGNNQEPDIGDLPVAEGAENLGWYVKPATLYAISKNTEHPKEAARLLNYLLNSKEMAEYQKTEKGIPVSKAALKVLEEENALNSDEYEANQTMQEKMDQMKVMLPIMENDSVLTTFKQCADDYLYDKITLEECAQEICDGINDIIGG